MYGQLYYMNGRVAGFFKWTLCKDSAFFWEDEFFQ